MTNLPKTFKLYLKNQGASSSTVKNYLSDFNHFWGWLILTLKKKLVSFDRKVPTTIISQITPTIITEYKDFLLANKIPVKTVNRRLSTLRKFGKFCISQAWLKVNPAERVSNAGLAKTEDRKPKADQVLDQFRQHLEKEQASSTTVKNYLSDLRHFLGWIEAI